MARFFNVAETESLGFGVGLSTNSTDWSFSCWVRPRSFIAGHRGLWGVLSGSGVHGVTLNNGAILVTILDVEDASAASSSNPALDAWSHIGVDYTHAGRGVRYWLNGVAAGTAGMFTDAVGSASNSAFCARANDSFFDGGFCEGAVWDVKLTQANWEALAAGASADDISGADQLVYAPVCGAASPEPDLSPAGLTVTVNGSPEAIGHPIGGHCGPNPKSFVIQANRQGW